MSSIRVLVVLGLGLLASLARAGPTPPPAPAPVVHLNAQEFRKLAEQLGGVYLDVRTPGEVARGRIPNASVIDFYDPKFKAKLELLQKGKPYFVYCASGKRSGAAADLMAQLGFTQLYDLQGGIGAWTSAGYPTDSTVPVSSGAKTMQPEALDALLRANQRVLVDYQTAWCTPCRAMGPVVDALAEAWKGKVAVVRVDVGESEALAARERVQGVPVFVLYVDGKERWRASGEMSQETLEKELAKP